MPFSLLIYEALCRNLHSLSLPHVHRRHYSESPIRFWAIMSANARAFLADLAKTRNSHFDNISNIRRGDSDGEVSFKYSNDSLGEPLDIQILSTGMSMLLSPQITLVLESKYLRKHFASTLIAYRRN